MGVFLGVDFTRARRPSAGVIRRMAWYSNERWTTEEKMCALSTNNFRLRPSSDWKRLDTRVGSTDWWRKRDTT